MNEDIAVTEAVIELIEELDITATQSPTNVWVIDAEKPVSDMKVFEQWEKGRPFKVKAVYHHPSGADFYLKNDSDPYGVLDTDTSQPFQDEELDMAPERPGDRHKVVHGETVFSIATAHKLSPTALMDHNEIKDPKLVTVGSWLYIPRRLVKERQPIEYRLLEDEDGKPTPRPMHVSREGGTTKLTFGNVKKWSDLKPDPKQYHEGQNVDIYAIAKVPVEDEVAAYYMDKHDLGKYKETGRVAYTRGFNWQHLLDGHYVEPVPALLASEISADAMMEDDRAIIPERFEETPEEVIEPLEEVVAAEPDEPLISPLERELDDYKTSFKYFNRNEAPELYRLLQDYEIRELDGASMTLQKKEGDKFMASGWFTHNNTPYYRLATRFWYAIPVHMAQYIEDDDFNEVIEMNGSLTLEEKIHAGKELTPAERRLVYFAKAVGKINRLKTLSAMLRHK